MLSFTIINLKNAVLFCVFFCQSHLTLYIHFSSFTPSCSFTYSHYPIYFFQLSVYFCLTFEVNKELMIWPSWTLNTVATFLCSNIVCLFLYPFSQELTVLKSTLKDPHPPTHPPPLSTVENLHKALSIWFILLLFWWSSSMIALFVRGIWFWNVCLSLQTLFARKIWICALMLENHMSCAGLTRSFKVGQKLVDTVVHWLWRKQSSSWESALPGNHTCSWAKLQDE